MPSTPDDDPVWVETKPSTAIEEDIAHIRSGSGGETFHMATHPHLLFAWATDAIAVYREWLAAKGPGNGAIADPPAE